MRYQRMTKCSSWGPGYRHCVQMVRTVNSLTLLSVDEVENKIPKLLQKD